MESLLLQAILSLLLLLSNISAFDEYDLNSTLDAYAGSYHQVLNDKFFMIELQTNVDPLNAEEKIKPEILRLEHLYQSKWAKEFLECKSCHARTRFHYVRESKCVFIRCMRFH
uniref:Uncharacterized protein n=1 Tax=Trichobilharzia regenti TaxID=157069 RepID=A0AA85J3V0_TRIRE|nr:unnamed protein product [Trichobilharzia regenti]